MCCSHNLLKLTIFIRSCVPIATTIHYQGELYDRVVEKSLSPEQHFSEYDAARILRNILEAISYCHDEKNICHRDLKVENFLLLNHHDESPVKIIDFGLSRFNPDNTMTTRVGTVYYVAPEVILSKEYSDKCDIWSIGT
jgi:calcium-dependent protein kinase